MYAPYLLTDPGCYNSRAGLDYQGRTQGLYAIGNVVQILRHGRR